jgi:hypothetical protein
MNRNFRVFITSVEIPGGKGWAEKRLRDIYEKSDKTYELTNSPELADMILVVDDWTKYREEEIIKNQYLKNYPNKCFSLTYVGRPIILNHGVYASCEKSILRINRIRTGSYSLYAVINPFIEQYLLSKTDASEKNYLFSFVGRNSHPTREVLFHHNFSRNDIYVENSSGFEAFESSPDKSERQKHYVEILASSKFSLCPRGWGAGSTRLFESMELGISPIIISDDWISPKGPKWDLFSVRVKEKHIREIEKIVVSLESSYEEMGNMARKEYNNYFSDHRYFNYVINNCIEIKKHQIIPERFYILIIPFYLRIRYFLNRLYKILW